MATEGKSSQDITENEGALERGQWTGRFDFLVSCVGFAIGLGNVWRFPYLVYENGGGAFLIPYFLTLILCGMPMFLMETAIGQYLSCGAIGVWKNVPLFKGIGYAAMIVSFWINCYYIIVIAWAIYFLYNSFFNPLPWSSCGNTWNTDTCNTDLASKDANSTLPSLEFWNNHVLGVTESISDHGGVQWHLALTLLMAWVLTYLCIFRGVEWLGKIVYFCAIYPYVMLVALLCRAATLDGAIDGIMYYIWPDFSRLMDLEVGCLIVAGSDVWMKASTQIFYSYGISLGSLIALGSYNKFNTNVYRDSLIVCCINASTSIFAGFVVFSILGFMAFEEGKSVQDVAVSGPGLAFIVYPAAVSKFPLPQLWAVLFFSMFLFLGLDSQFCTVEGLIASLTDEFPKLKHRRKLILLVYCAISYLIGLSMITGLLPTFRPSLSVDMTVFIRIANSPYITQGGIYVFQLFDHYSAAGMTILFLAFWEVFALSWCYGADHFYKNIQEMIGYQPIIWWKLCWRFFTPGYIIILLILNFIFFTRAKYIGYFYPTYAEVLGLAIGMSSMICIPIYAIYIFSKTEGTFMQRMKKLTRPRSVKRRVSVTPISFHYTREGDDLQTASHA